MMAAFFLGSEFDLSAWANGIDSFVMFAGNHFGFRV